MLVPCQNTFKKRILRAVAWGHNTNEIQKTDAKVLQKNVTNTQKVTKKTAGITKTLPEPQKVTPGTTNGDPKGSREKKR